MFEPLCNFAGYFLSCLLFISSCGILVCVHAARQTGWVRIIPAYFRFMLTACTTAFLLSLIAAHKGYGGLAIMCQIIFWFALWAIFYAARFMKAQTEWLARLDFLDAGLKAGKTEEMIKAEYHAMLAIEASMVSSRVTTRNQLPVWGAVRIG